MVFSAIPQVITEDRASGAQVFEGSLAINNDRSQYLRKTFSNEGNRRTFTWSSWVRRSSFGDWQRIFTCEPSSSLIAGLSFTGTTEGASPTDAIRIQQQDSGGNNNHFRTNAAYRDTGWYHIVMRVDTTSGTPGDRIRLYVNGELQPHIYPTGGNPGLNSTFGYNSTSNYHEIGHSTNYNAYYDGRMTQCYWIDGQSLGPEEFGYTDPLTNTWRPKKYDQLGPNNGTTWSDNVTSSNFYSGSATNVFNGYYGSAASVNSSDASNNHITLSSVNVVASKVGVVLSNSGSDVQVYVNGSLVGTAAAGDIVNNDPKHFEFTFTETTVSTIKVQRVSSTSGWQIYGVSLNGVTLIDGDTSNMGGNGFYLPMDGSAPIGKDQSGRGNDWTSINIGGSVELPKATGAIPILDTNEAGNVAKLNARTDSKTYTVTASGGNYYLDGALKPTLNAYRGGTYTFDYTGATSHPFYLSSLPDGKHNSKAYSVEFNGSNQYLTHPNDSTITDWSSGDYTIELWAYFDSFNIGSNSNTHLIGAAAIDSGAESWSLGPNSSGQVVWYYWNGSQQRVTGGTITTGRWYHLAMTHSGGVITIFIDGKLSTTGGVSGTPQASTLPLRIGKITSSGGFDGYVSNVRIVRGSAVYTSNFTPSQTTLTNITNTTFLACQDSDATTAPVAPGTITATGAAATQTYQPFLYNNNHGNFGVNTGTSNTTKITIPHLAADTLYYYCNDHSGMGSSINVTTDIRKADPYAWKCVLALPLDGSTAVNSAKDVRDQLNCNETAKSFSTSGNAAALTSTANFYGVGGFAFDGNGDYLQTAYDEDFNFGWEDFTVEAWAKSNQSNSYAPIVGRWTSAQSTAAWDLRLATADFGNRVSFITRDDNGGNGGTFRVIDSGFNANDGYWHHIAACRTGNTIKIFIDGVEKVSGSYPYKINTNTGQPLRVGYNDSHYYDGRIQDVRIYKGVAKYTENFAPASTDPEVLPDTPSGIPLKTQLKEVPTTDGGSIAFGPAQSDYLRLDDDADTRLTNTFSIELFYHEANQRTHGAFITDGGGSSSPVSGGTTNGISYQLYHNAGAIYLNWSNGSGTWYNINNVNMPASVGWHHLVVTNDISRTRMFIDGVLVGQHQEHDWGVATSGRKVYIGTMSAGPGTGTQGSYNSHGYISNIRICNGSVPTEYVTTATSSGTKVFNPPSAPLTTTSQGANSSHVKLLCAQSQTSPTTATVSPSSITKFNNVYASKFNPFTNDINIIRGQASGYATLNPLVLSGGATISNGNLDIAGSSPYRTTPSTIGIKSGKYYWEYHLKFFNGGATDCHFGICLDNFMDFRDTWVLSTNYGWGYTCQGGLGYHGNSQINLGSSARTTGDTIAFSFDADVGELYIYVNGVVINSGNPAFTGLTNAPYYPFVSTGSSACSVSCNFGQKPFKFPPPDGFQPLNLSNVQPEKVIARPDQYFSTKLYTGNGASTPGGSGGTQSINVGFEPDMIWIKDLTQAHNHNVLDTVRGPNSIILPDDPRNAVTNSSDAVTAFTDNGFTLGDNGEGTQSLELNKSGNNYVVWSWKAGGSQYTYNKDYMGGSSASDIGVSATSLTLAGATINTKSKFGIYKYNGSGSGAATLTHALEGTPTFIMYKNLDAGAGSSWQVYHKELGGSAYINLDEPAGQYTSDSTRWAGTDPTSTTITLGTHGNGSDNFMMYAWCDVPGMFKTGKYVNNASADGPFIELGFKPAMVIIKCTGGGTNWRLADNVRNSYNNGSSTKWLKPSTPDTEADERAVDFVSNGIKIRSTSGGDINQSTNAGTITYIYAAWAEAPTVNLYGAQANAR